MNPNQDKELQASLLNLQPGESKEIRRLKDGLVVVAIVAAGGWITVGLLLWLTK